MIQTEAIVCRFCAADQTTTSRSNYIDPESYKATFGRSQKIAAGVILLVLFLGFCGYNPQIENTVGESGGPLAASGPIFDGVSPDNPKIALTTSAPITISAVDLEAAYDENEVAAQTKFDGRPLIINGAVDRIDLDSDDNAVVFVETGAFLAMSVHLPPHQKPLAASLKKGQVITFQCASVSELMSKPIVEDCFVTDPMS